MVLNWQYNTYFALWFGVLAAALAASCAAQECFSGSEIDLVTAKAVAAAAQQYFNLSAQGERGTRSGGELPRHRASRDRKQGNLRPGAASRNADFRTRCEQFEDHLAAGGVLLWHLQFAGPRGIRHSQLASGTLRSHHCQGHWQGSHHAHHDSAGRGEEYVEAGRILRATELDRGSRWAVVPHQGT